MSGSVRFVSARADGMGAGVMFAFRRRKVCVGEAEKKSGHGKTPDLLRGRGLGLPLLLGESLAILFYLDEFANYCM